MPGRGIAFLKEICEKVAVPVYAIGGITQKNIGLIKEAGAAGACVMSSVMTAEDVKGYLESLQKKSPHKGGESKIFIT